MKRLKKDFGLILISLIFSVMLWTYVQSQLLMKTQITETFTLGYLNLDPSLSVTQIPKAIKVTAEGSPEAIHDLQKANPQNLNAYVDLSNPQIGVGAYPVFIQRDSVRDYGITYGRPDKVIVVVEKTVQSSPKKVEADVEPPPGYAVASVDVVPTAVIISGPQTDLNKIARVRAHEVIKTPVSGQVLRTVKVDVLDDRDKAVPNVTVDPPTVELTPALTEAVRQKNVPIIFNWSGIPAFGYNVGEDYTAHPGQVTISGKPEVLRNISSVSTEPIPIGGAKADLEKTVRLKSPGPGVQMNITRVRVYVPITPPKAPSPPPPAATLSDTQPSPKKQ